MADPNTAAAPEMAARNARALRSIPAADHPLRWERYSAICDQIADAANGFAELGLDDVSAQLNEARDRLVRAWSAIVTAEREGR